MRVMRSDKLSVAMPFLVFFYLVCLKDVARAFLLNSQPCGGKSSLFVRGSTAWNPREAFALSSSASASASSRLYLAENNQEEVESSSSKEGVQEYRNAATQVLSLFMNKDDGNCEEKKKDPLATVDFSAPKLAKKLDLETLARVLDYELYNSEWFVTGKVNPIYFADEFRFEDPDVKLDGIENYARGVRTIFDQETSRAEIISTEVSSSMPEDTITVTWRLSGKANIGPGLTLKPYIVYTDFTVDNESGLIVFQRDRFDLPQWDILLSSLFPFLIGKVTSPPAPPVEPRVVTKPSGISGLGAQPTSGSSASKLPFGGMDKNPFANN